MTTLASHLARSARVSRTADPALITSVDDRDPPPGKVPKRLRDDVADRKQPLRFVVRLALGVDEFDIELSSHQKAHEGPFNERAADDLGLVRRQPFGYLSCQRADEARPPEKRLELEPEIPVVTGLEFEVSALPPQKPCQVFAHDLRA